METTGELLILIILTLTDRHNTDRHDGGAKSRPWSACHGAEPSGCDSARVRDPNMLGDEILVLNGP